MIRGSLIFQKIREISRKFFGPGVAGSSSIVGWVGDNNQWMYYISCEIGFVKFFHYNKHGSIYRACTPSALAHFVYVRAWYRVHKLGGLRYYFFFFFAFIIVVCRGSFLGGYFFSLNKLF